MGRVSSDVPNDGSQKNNKLAFEESVSVMVSLYEGRWLGKREIVVDDTLHLTLAVSSAMALNWEEVLMGFAGDPHDNLRCRLWIPTKLGR